MIIQPKVLWGPQLVPAASGGSLSSLLYTAPNFNAPVLVSSAVFTNTQSGARTFSVYVVRRGGALNASNGIIILKPLASTQSYPASELAGLVLNPGDTLWSNADTAGIVTSTGSGWSV